MPARLIDGFATTDALAEVFSDEAVAGAMLRFEIALARAQARLGMIPQAAAEAIGKLDRIGAAGLAWQARESATLVIPFLRVLKSRLDPAAARYVHWGSTSQDVLDTALVLLLRAARPILESDRERLERALRALSDKHAGSLMQARTLLQPALATTFGYKVAGWYGELHRSWRRLAKAFDDALQLQFGGACGTLATYGDRGPELAAVVAAELELPPPVAPWHAHRDCLAALVTNCGIYAGGLAKIARDIALLMQSEIGEVAERGGGSSTMPHKRNPAASVVALAAAARLPGLVAAFLAAMPQEHERAAGGWQSEWPTVAGAIQATGSTLAAVADAIDGLTVDSARMRANLGGVPTDLGAAEIFRRRLLEESE